MKAVIALTASIAVANAALMPRQGGIAGIPQCALSCALGSLGDTGCQSQTDFACICKATAFIAGLVPCVQKACSADDFQKTIVAAQGLCQSAGVSLSVPAGVTETGAASATGSSSAVATSAPATTTAPTTEATGVTSASSEPTSAPTSAAVTSAAQSSAAATTTGAPTSASGSNSTVSSTSPPKPSGTEPSAAHRNTIALGGLGAIIALVAAFL